MSSAINVGKEALDRACRAIAGLDEDTLQAIVGTLRDCGQRPGFLDKVRGEMEAHGISAEDAAARIVALITLDQTRAALAAAALH